MPEGLEIQHSLMTIPSQSLYFGSKRIENSYHRRENIVNRIYVSVAVQILSNGACNWIGSCIYFVKIFYWGVSGVVRFIV
jgi:hypothetical protein